MGLSTLLITDLLSAAVALPICSSLQLCVSRDFTTNNIQLVCYVLKSSQVSIEIGKEFHLYPKLMVL